MTHGTRIGIRADELYKHLFSADVLAESCRQFGLKPTAKLRVALMIVNRCLGRKNVARLDATRLRIIADLKAGGAIQGLKSVLEAQPKPWPIRIAEGEGIRGILLEDLEVSGRLGRKRPTDSGWYDHAIPSGVLYEYERF